MHAEEGIKMMAEYSFKQLQEFEDDDDSQDESIEAKDRKKLSNRDRGYQVCGVRNRQKKPCQRVGVCPFHGTRTPLNIPGDDFERERHTVCDFKHDSIKAESTDAGTFDNLNQKRKHEDIVYKPKNSKNNWQQRAFSQFVSAFPSQTPQPLPTHSRLPISPYAALSNQGLFGNHDTAFRATSPVQQSMAAGPPRLHQHPPQGPPSPLYRGLSPHFYPHNPPDYRPFWVPPNYHGQIVNRRYSSHPVLPSLPSKEEFESMGKRPRSKTMEDFECSAEELRRRSIEGKESMESRGHLNRAAAAESIEEEKKEEKKEERVESVKRAKVEEQEKVSLERRASIASILSDPFDRVMATHALSTYRKPEVSDDANAVNKPTLPRLSSIQGTAPLPLPPLSQFPRPFYPPNLAHNK
eukprot:TRINITY_DN1322_c1_g1_i1.p1 TRINITY_DN1322_c1_g1~~TRINITY_DN1322_c1_g1_i1.p1  ORF type:complete len:409 (+),score=127.01 TRINITY_DN1322_c1_g1_i1:174-1400(+)